MWSSLAKPWQEAFSLAWEALRVGTVPIGAVITNAEGEIIATGRNGIKDGPECGLHVFDHELAHAELNALLSLSKEYRIKPAIYQYTLYSTLEPCPLCMGAIYMSGLRKIRFASRDPYAGSTNLIGSTPYLSVKSMDVDASNDPILENLGTAFQVYYSLDFERHDKLINLWEKEIPVGVRIAKRWRKQNTLQQAIESGYEMAEVFDKLINDFVMIA